MIYLDIETLPSCDENLIKELRESIAAPAQYKKQESIDKWMEENAENQLNELLAKTSFDGMYGRIACMAWALNDGEIVSTDKDMSERECLLALYDYIDEHVSPIDETLCGHNIAGFDLPFIKHRSIILGIKPPIFIINAVEAKPWHDCIADTMLMWSSDRSKYQSMDRLCKALGIKGKEGFDGSMVAETWPVNPQKVIEYCCDDVRRTRAIYKRLTFQFPHKSMDKANEQLTAVNS